MFKMITLVTSTLIGLSLSAILPAQGPGGSPPPPPKKKGHGAKEDLRKAYDSIRRLRLDEGRGGRPEERLRDWAERAADLYRKGVRAMDDGDEHLAHEYGAMAHDLARAADHASNAARFDHRDDDLPPPPGGSPGEEWDRLVRDLRHAYDRIRDVADKDPTREARFYLDAARDLYNAARRDAEDDRLDRAGELARAAEAMSHVPEHMMHAERGPDAPPPPDRKKAEPKKARRPGPPERKAEPKKGRRPEPGGELPPPLD